MRVGGEKRLGVSISEVRDILENDLRDGQYFVTGRATRRYCTKVFLQLTPDPPPDTAEHDARHVTGRLLTQ